MKDVCRSLWFVGAVVVAAWSCPAQVVLNEVCARNNGAALNPIGTSPDYVELFNTSSSAVSLAGWTLTDSPKTPGKFAFPATASIAARSALVVWLDSTNNYTGVICTNFNLKGSGEHVQLYQGSTLRDAIAFGPQVENRSLCRLPDGTGGWQLAQPTAGAANVALQAGSMGVAFALRLNEWMATNSAGTDFDWLEVYNPGTNGIVALAGLVISDQAGGVSTAPLPQHSYIGSGEFLRYWCDDDTGEDHLPFRLSSTSGETLSIYQPDKVSLIDRVSFGPQQADVSMGRLPDGGTNLLYFSGTDVSPEGPNSYKEVTSLVVNEVLAHTDPPLEDAIELFNPAAAPLDISHWWLSNDPDFPYKFRVPAGTHIPARGYLVFYEQNQFNAISSTPGFNRSGTGKTPDFSLNSAHGDSVALFEALPNGALTGYRVKKDFEASANGVSFGRHVKSDGGTDFVPTSARTFGSDSPVTVTQFRTGTGATNSGPLVGPIGISEIFYEPAPIIGGGSTNDNTLDEFVELSNLERYAVPLFDPVYPTNRWRVRGGIDFDLPANVSLPASSSMLIVNFDPKTNLTQLAAFRAKYAVSNSVPIFGPYNGKLNNSSDTIELQRPDSVQLPPHPDAGFVPFLLVEKVKYESGAGWPSNAVGTGLSIQRLDPRGYANDQTNWFAATPSPGWIRSSAVPPAPVQLVNPGIVGSYFEFSFISERGRNHVVEYSEGLQSGHWSALTNIVGTGSTVKAMDQVSPVAPRFYRVRSW